MKKLTVLLALAMPTISHGAILAIDSLVINSSDIQPGTGDIRGNATLVSITTSAATYSNFELITSITGISATALDTDGYVYAVDGTNPGSYAATILDSDPVSGGLNAGSSAFYRFGRVLGLNEVIFMIGNSGDGPSMITALDGNGVAIGTRILTAVNSSTDLATADYARSNGGTGLNARAIRGATFTAADFGGSGGDISLIQGFRVSNGNYDPNMVGIATIPEASSLLLGLAGLLLLQRRRR